MCQRCVKLANHQAGKHTKDVSGLRTDSERYAEITAALRRDGATEPTLARYGLDVTPIDDTMLISYVLHGASHGHGMDELAQRYLNHDCIPYTAVCGKGAAQIGFAAVPVDKATAFAA